MPDELKPDGGEPTTPPRVVLCPFCNQDFTFSSGDVRFDGPIRKAAGQPFPRRVVECPHCRKPVRIP